MPAPTPEERVDFKFNKGKTRWADADQAAPQIWVENDGDIHSLAISKALELEELGRGKIVRPEEESLSEELAEVLDAADDDGDDGDDEPQVEDPEALATAEAEVAGEDKRKPGILDKLTKKKPGPAKKDEVEE